MGTDVSVRGKNYDGSRRIRQKNYAEEIRGWILRLGHRKKVRFSQCHPNFPALIVGIKKHLLLLVGSFPSINRQAGVVKTLITACRPAESLNATADPLSDRRPLPVVARGPRVGRRPRLSCVFWSIKPAVAIGASLTSIPLLHLKIFIVSRAAAFDCHYCRIYCCSSSVRERDEVSPAVPWRLFKIPR